MNSKKHMWYSWSITHYGSVEPHKTIDSHTKQLISITYSHKTTLAKNNKLFNNICSSKLSTDLLINYLISV